LARLFFLLSGEHPTLPYSELKAILEADGRKYRFRGALRQVIRLEADVECIEPIVRRAALTRVCCKEIVYARAVKAEILAKTRLSSFKESINKGQTFVVRVRRIGESAPEIETTELERELGAVIVDKVNGARGKMISPDVTFFGVLSEDRFIFGRRLAEIPAKPYMERRPRKRPFFHPSAMPAKLARCMVNLAQPASGDLVLDPFCGTGSFLIEASLIGCQPVGFDSQRRMVKGSLRNLHFYGVNPEGVLRADARYPPLRRVDRVVTDPPYGRSSTTMGREVNEIVHDFLLTAESYVPIGKRICIAFPKGLKTKKSGERSGFKLVESHFVYVHRSLTRQIAVLERVGES
jgi:tRNA (guanine10-N2)-dimethyltransferase